MILWSSFDPFFKVNILDNPFSVALRLSNGFDLYDGKLSVCSDLGQNCLLGLLVDNNNRHWHVKEFILISS